ncbi:class I SAM-dependent methyltransferase [Serpentinicella alkaliphila]|nr:class I SAM-dependent methyltransferase [Serpentinicella alkaliphila]
MGNGNDTLFLTKLLGSKGKIYSFDIQIQAIDKTKKLLEENNFIETENANLILDSHGNIGSYVKEEIDIAMFNLGYLPGGDHTVVTNGEITLKALKYILSLLKKSGIISLIIYYGHEGGKEEKDSIISFTNSLDSRSYRVLRCDYTNQGNNPPIVLFIEKK